MRVINPDRFRIAFKVIRRETKKASAKTEQQYDEEEEVYIGREGKMIRRREESKEMRGRRGYGRPKSVGGLIIKSCAASFPTIRHG
jgi:hypothetical protein